MNVGIFADRKKADRERLRKEGFVLKQIWVRPQDWPRIKAYIERFRRRSEKK